MQHLFSNTAQPYRWLFPRGAVTKFRADEPFYRDPFINSKYGFGCAVFRLDRPVLKLLDKDDAVETVRAALQEVPESALWGGGRVGVYSSLTGDANNFLVVFAGLTEEQERDMVHVVEKYELEFVLNKTKALLTAPLDPHAPHRETYKLPKITHFANAVHKFDEWGAKAQRNRKDIAEKVAAALGCSCTLQYECVYTYFHEMVLFNDAVGPKPNVHIAYDHVQKALLVKVRRAYDSMDKAFQAVPVVARLKELGGAPTNPRFFGASADDKYEVLESDDRFKMENESVLQPLCVRCADSRYDDWFNRET